MPTLLTELLKIFFFQLSPTLLAYLLGLKGEFFSKKSNGFYLKYNPSQRILFQESLVKLLSITTLTHTVIIIVLIYSAKSTFSSELFRLLTLPQVSS